MLLLDGTSKYRLRSPHSISSSGNITKSDNKVFHSLRKSLFLEEGERYIYIDIHIDPQDVKLLANLYWNQQAAVRHNGEISE